LPAGCSGPASSAGGIDAAPIVFCGEALASAAASFGTSLASVFEIALVFMMSTLLIGVSRNRKGASGKSKIDKRRTARSRNSPHRRKRALHPRSRGTAAGMIQFRVL
jgi:hypothetical protein